MPNLSLRQQLITYRARVKYLRWIIGGAGAMVCASMLLPPLFSLFAVSSGLRIVVALASGVLAVAAAIAARATQSRLVEFEWAMGDLAERARDLKARAAIDPTARVEYVAYLRDSRDELESMSQRLRVQGYITENQLLPALEAIDAEIASHDTALGAGVLHPSVILPNAADD